jgi:hypothetical protein
MGDTSIGPGPGRGGNDNRDLDPMARTLGEAAPAPQAPASPDLVDQAAPPVPAGVPGAPPQPAVSQGAESFPDGPNGEASPWELEAARGKVPKP